jgi:hypothetical protein
VAWSSGKHCSSGSSSSMGETENDFHKCRTVQDSFQLQTIVEAQHRFIVCIATKRGWFVLVTRHNIVPLSQPA